MSPSGGDETPFDTDFGHIMQQRQLFWKYVALGTNLEKSRVALKVSSRDKISNRKRITQCGVCMRVVIIFLKEVETFGLVIQKMHTTFIYLFIYYSTKSDK